MNSRIPNRVDHISEAFPSYVAFTETERIIGDGAKNQASMNPENTVYDAKRLIGRKFSDPVIKNEIESFPFDVVSDNSDKPIIKVNYKKEEKKSAKKE